MTTLTYMHPHHCNSSANVLKKASWLLHGKKKMLCLGTIGKSTLVSIMSLNDEEGSPCTSVFHGSAFRWKNDLRFFWQQGQPKQLPPPLLALHVSFPPPEYSLQQCQNNCSMGLNAGLPSQVKNNPAKN